MFKKPKKNPKAKFRSRKRSADTNPTVDGDGTIVGDQDRDNTSNKRFRQKNNRVSDNSDSDEESDGNTLLEQYKDEQSQQKNGKLGKSNKKSNIMHQYQSNNGGPSQKDLATRTAEHHPEEKGGGGVTSGDGNDDSAVEDTNGKKLYKGNKNTRNKFLAGPIKAPTFVRTTSRFDYQPDICKDYKDTGFCGFGDSCIYLHDRGNTLSGWQLEQEYERKKKETQDMKEREMDLFCREVNAGSNDASEQGSSGVTASLPDDGLPFACHLCREPFTDPVVTSCNHYFCQKCIMGYIKRENTTACPVCSQDTHGVFNHPTKLFSKKRRLLGSSATWTEFAEKYRN